MGRGHTARFFRVIHEIGLAVIVFAIGNNFNRVFIGTDRSVRTQTDKDTAGDIIGFDIKRIVIRQRRVRYIVINTDNYLKNAFATEAVFSFAYEVYADEAMTDLLYEEDCFADNIVPAGFTLYSGNEATIDISDFWTEEYTTWYVRVKANGNAERNVTESDWTELFEITFNNTSTVPFDYGFGRESNVGNFG